MTHDQHSFGTLLRRFRMAAGLTQEELAEQASLSVRGISDLERGINTRPRPYTIRRLADTLRLSPDDREALLAASPSLHEAPPGQPPHNLPFELTPLIGRERELAHALRLLRSDGVRLLTLTGPGGVGKTRLAQAIAGAMLGDAPDGVVMVSLAPVHDADLVIQAIAHALGLSEESGRPVLNTVAAYLRNRALLLLVDNFEQVASAAPCLVEVLTSCPALRMLVTSRMPLHVRGEHELDVPPLATPGRHAELHAANAGISRFPSVALFVQRAQAVKPDFELTVENSNDVAQLCRKLDGLPLAIELAAAQVKFLSPRMLLTQVERRLDLLTTGAQDLPPRQRTLRDTIAWSYDLLAAEQRLFSRLAVFSGGCDIPAVAAVCGGPGDLALDPLRGMISLVDKSLVTLDTRAPDDTPRFDMLETIREFAQEQLDKRGETDALRERHADYYFALAEQAEPALWGMPDQATWTQRLNADMDNLRAAFAWYLDHGQAERAMHLVNLLGMFLFYTGRLSEGRRWLEAVLDAAPDAAPDERARALSHLGSLALNQSDHARAKPVLEESLALWRSLGDARWTAFVLMQVAHVWRDAGDWERARPLLEESLALSAGQGESWGIVRGIPLVTYSTLLLDQGDGVSAETHLQEVLALGRRMRNQVLTAIALNVLAWTAHDAGNHDQSLELARESLALLIAASHHQGQSDVLSTLGWVSLWSDNIERAAEYFNDCLRLSWERESKRHTANALRGLSMVAIERGELTRGVRLYAGATMLWPIFDLPHAPSKAAVERRVAQARNQLGEAAWHTAWSAGQAQSAEAAIADALAQSRPDG